MRELVGLAALASILAAVEIFIYRAGFKMSERSMRPGGFCLADRDGFAWPHLGCYIEQSAAQKEASSINANGGYGAPFTVVELFLRMPARFCQPNRGVK